MADEAIPREELEKEFERAHPLYESFAVRLRDLLDELVRSKGLTIHVIESRAKTKASFIEKVQRPGKRYSKPLEEITDLVGCRVICYYNDDCKKVSQLLRNEFQVREEELSHQPDRLEADRFGYLSAHYIVSLSKARSKLPEWAAYGQLYCEIQVRTVIQHAWSAVSHALQYKVETSVASSLQRRLNRLAGLFELADDEFVGIRDQREKEKSAAAKAIRAGASIPLSPSSVSEFLAGWKEADKLSLQAERAGFILDDEESIQVDNIIKLARRMGVPDTQELERLITGDNFQVLKEIYDVDGVEWHSNIDFIVLLILIAKFRENIDTELLLDFGFDKKIAEEVFEGINRFNSKS